LPSTCDTHAAPAGAAPLGWAVSEGVAVFAVAALSVTLADTALLDVALLDVRLGCGLAPGAGPAPPQAAITTQATAAANAAVRVRHRFLPRCTQRL
jgi:hypothetical protein